MLELIVVSQKEADGFKAAAAFAVGDIRPANGSTAKRDVVIPVDGVPQRVKGSLREGEYQVRVRMPDGALHTETVSVPSDLAPAVLIVRSSGMPMERSDPYRVDKLKRSADYGERVARVKVQIEDDVPKPSWSKHVLPLPVINWVGSQATGRVHFDQLGDATQEVSLHRVRAMHVDFLADTRSIGAPQLDSETAARMSFGSAVAVQPAKVTRSGGSEVQKWKLAQRGKQPEDAATGRYFSALVSNGKDGAQVQKVVPIPQHWLQKDGSREELQLQFTGSMWLRDAVGLRLTVSDPLATSLLNFLQNGDLNGALAVGRSDWEIPGWDANPYEKVAEAYALVYSRHADAEEGWEAGILHLSRKVKDIPDPSILLATLLLQRKVKAFVVLGEEFPPAGVKARAEMAWRSIRDAVGMGPPMFRLGLRLLHENLCILLDSDFLPQGEIQRVKLALNVVGNWRARVDPTQALCVFDVSSL